MRVCPVGRRCRTRVWREDGAHVERSSSIPSMFSSPWMMAIASERSAFATKRGHFNPLMFVIAYFRLALPRAKKILR
jgi:hypothetical protein